MIQLLLATLVASSVVTACTQAQQSKYFGRFGVEKLVVMFSGGCPVSIGISLGVVVDNSSTDGVYYTDIRQLKKLVDEGEVDKSVFEKEEPSPSAQPQATRKNSPSTTADEEDEDNQKKALVELSTGIYAGTAQEEFIEVYLNAATGVEATTGLLALIVEEGLILPPPDFCSSSTAGFKAETSAFVHQRLIEVFPFQES